MMNGWIKSQNIPQGEIKQGRMVLVLKLNELPIIAKIHDVTEDSIKIDDTALIYEVHHLSLYEIVMEYMDGGLKTIPLKQTQWKLAIENGELNTGKLVSFIVKERGNKLLARVVNEKKRLTPEQIDEFAYEAYMQGAKDNSRNNASKEMYRNWRMNNAL